MKNIKEGNKTPNFINLRCGVYEDINEEYTCEFKKYKKH